MSYTPPNTFVAGTVVQASLLQENLQEMQEYANGGVVAGDLSTSPWVEQQHIVRPSYESATRTFTAVSGVSSAASRRLSWTRVLCFLPTYVCTCEASLGYRLTALQI